MLPGGRDPAFRENWEAGCYFWFLFVCFILFFTVTYELLPLSLVPTKVTVSYYEEEGSAPIDQAGLFLTAIGELVLGHGCLHLGGPGKIHRAGFSVGGQLLGPLPSNARFGVVHGCSGTFRGDGILSRGDALESPSQTL